MADLSTLKTKVSESRAEEDKWLAAIEDSNISGSMGTDVINALNTFYSAHRTMNINASSSL